MVIEGTNRAPDRTDTNAVINTLLQGHIEPNRMLLLQKQLFPPVVSSVIQHLAKIMNLFMFRKATSVQHGKRKNSQLCLKDE